MRRRRINPPKRSKSISPSLKDFRRFFKKVEEDEHGCWVWQGYTDENGYGKIKYKGKTYWVHRWAYCVFKRSVRDGDHVDHVCRNPSCARPAHLRRVPMGQHLSESGSRRYDDDGCPPF